MIPSGALRSLAPKRSSSATSGVGFGAQSRYRSGRFWRAMSSRSVNPSVAISAVRAPRSSSRALVPTVIPWANASISAAIRAGTLQRRLDRGHHPARLVIARARRLRGVQGPAVEQNRVREGPADVDAEQHAGTLDRVPTNAKGPSEGPGPSGTVASSAHAAGVGARLRALRAAARRRRASPRGACGRGSTHCPGSGVRRQGVPCGCGRCTAGDVRRGRRPRAAGTGTRAPASCSSRPPSRPKPGP